MADTQYPALCSTGWNCDHIVEFSNVPCTSTIGNGWAADGRQLDTGAAEAKGLDATNPTAPRAAMAVAASKRHFLFTSTPLTDGRATESGRLSSRSQGPTWARIGRFASEIRL